MSLYDHLLACDDTWAEAGVPPLPEWWRNELGRVYEHATANLHVARVGRGGNKSTAAIKCIVVELLFGDWAVPRGERHWAINISENLDEAKARLGQAAEYLEILDVPFDRTAEQILLRDLPLGFWSRAARIGALKGPRTVAWMIDEAATMSVDGVNPCAELLASLRATSITHPHARGRIYSSPFATLDEHYKLVEEGDTAQNVVSIAPSWVANPDGITEERTREIEPDEPTRLREYGAVPLDAAGLVWFDHRAIAKSIMTGEHALKPNPQAIVGVGADFAFRRDSSALATVHLVDGIFSVAAMLEMRPQPGAPLKPSYVVGRFAREALYHGTRHVMCDGHYVEAIREHLLDARLTLHDAPAGLEGKSKTYALVRTILNEGRLRLLDNPRVAAQFKNVIAKPNPSGTLSIESPRKDGGHGDIVSAIVLAIWHANLIQEGLRRPKFNRSRFLPPA